MGLMKILVALTAASLLSFASAGCTKHSEKDKSEPAAAPAATTAETAGKPVASAEHTATATASEQDAEGASCGEDKADCSGGCDQWDEKAADVSKRDVPGDAEWSTISVSGMTCGGCEKRIIAKLGEVEGVLAVEADAELGQVRVAMAKGQDLRTAAVDRINSLGYKAQ